VVGQVAVIIFTLSQVIMTRSIKSERSPLEALWRRLLAPSQTVDDLRARLRRWRPHRRLPRCPVVQATASLLPPSERTPASASRASSARVGAGHQHAHPVDAREVMIAVLESRQTRRGTSSRSSICRRSTSVRFMQDAVKDLARHYEVQADRRGHRDMSLEDRDPKRAAAMLQTYIDMLDRFNREVRTTKGRRTRSSSSSGSTECKSDMAKAEQALADYQSSHKAAIITPAQSTAPRRARGSTRSAPRSGSPRRRARLFARRIAEVQQIETS
jgi:hypothetical protein